MLRHKINESIYDHKGLKDKSCNSCLLWSPALESSYHSDLHNSPSPVSLTSPPQNIKNNQNGKVDIIMSMVWWTVINSSHYKFFLWYKDDNSLAHASKLVVSHFIQYTISYNLILLLPSFPLYMGWWNSHNIAINSTLWNWI